MEYLEELRARMNQGDYSAAVEYRQRRVQYPERPWTDEEEAEFMKVRTQEYGNK